MRLEVGLMIKPAHLRTCFWVRILCNNCAARWDIAVSQLGDVKEQIICPADKQHTEITKLAGTGCQGMTSATVFPHITGPFALDNGAGEEIKAIRHKDWRNRRKKGWKRTPKLLLSAKAASAGTDAE
jgi:hypothetical protein